MFNICVPIRNFRFDDLKKKTKKNKAHQSEFWRFFLFACLAHFTSVSSSTSFVWKEYVIIVKKKLWMSIEIGNLKARQKVYKKLEIWKQKKLLNYKKLLSREREDYKIYCDGNILKLCVFSAWFEPFFWLDW